MDIIELPMNLIDEDTDQPRYQFDEEALQELMGSISEIGLLSPIKVRTTPNGRYKIIYGNRRYKANERLGRPTIPCIVSNVTDEMEIYLEQIAENLTREGFSPIEEAEAFHKLLNDARFSSSTKYLSGKLGKPENYIKNKLELLKFGNAVRKLIAGGTEIRKDKLTEDQLMPLKDLPMEYRDTLALLAARDELSVPDVKKIAKLFKDPGISEGTKGKLLYKTGYELIDTWSVFEANRREREKAAKAAEAAKLERLEAAERRKAEPEDDEEEEEKPKQAAAGAAAVEGKPGSAGVAVGGTAAGSEGVTVGTGSGGSTAESVEPIVSVGMSAPSIVGALERLLFAYPAYRPLSPEFVASLSTLPPELADRSVAAIDQAIDNLEKHLAEFKTLREQAFAKA